MASTLAGSLFLALLIALPATAVPPADEPPASEKEKGWFQRRKEAKTESGPSATAMPATAAPETKTKPTRTVGGWFNRSTPPLSTSDPLGVVRLQIFLDQSHFGPGKIDGSLGGFTNKAVDLRLET